MPLLTKSKYLSGLQCPKLLWTVFNAPDRILKPDAATQHIFDQGHLVGGLARKLFPDGIDIPTDNFKENISKTKELLAERRPLFEAGFMASGLFARPDILTPSADDGWDIVEVKSATSIKDINIHDMAFQRYCYEKAGLNINRCFLMHINNGYVRNGDIEPEQLFVKQDITEDVKNAAIGIQEKINGMFQIIESKSCPDKKIGQQCSYPYECALHDSCWSFVPDNSVFDLYRGGEKSYELYERGILSIKDIPDKFNLTANQQIQKNCVRTGKPHIEKEKLKGFLDSLIYPVNYLDFETICRQPIPLYNGLRPYQHIPFQFSLHIQSGKGRDLEHISFLAEGKKDPRQGFLSALKDAMGSEGSILVYNRSFEIGRLKELAEMFPEYKRWIYSLLDRFIDLLIPFQNFWYYHPGQHGSASLKSVLPAVTGKGYSDMEIADGETAFLEYLRITFGDSDGRLPDEREIIKVRHNLEKYCGLDTESMVWIVDAFWKIVS